MHKRTEIPKLPEGYQHLERPMIEFVEKYSHISRNVFIMMPFSLPGSGKIYKAIADTLNAYGLEPIRADKKSFTNFIWSNIVTQIIGCSYGVAVYEPMGDILFNPNVSIEAGFMLALDKPVLFLANQSLNRLPVDFTGHIYKTFSPYKLKETINTAIRDWVERDLSLYDYSDKKLVVFVSRGGTCRCVMAKGLLSKILDDYKITGIKVEAAAIADPHQPTVSPSAIEALKYYNASKWLEGHRPRKMCRYLQEHADLIIGMTDVSLNRSCGKADKYITDRELFGEKIKNPYPDDQDAKSLKKYKNSCKSLAEHLERKLPEIMKRLGM